MHLSTVNNQRDMDERVGRTVRTIQWKTLEDSTFWFVLQREYYEMVFPLRSESFAVITIKKDSYGECAKQRYQLKLSKHNGVAKCRLAQTAQHLWRANPRGAGWGSTQWRMGRLNLYPLTVATAPLYFLKVSEHCFLDIRETFDFVDRSAVFYNLLSTFANSSPFSRTSWLNFSLMVHNQTKRVRSAFGRDGRGFESSHWKVVYIGIALLKEAKDKKQWGPMWFCSTQI